MIANESEYEAVIAGKRYNYLWEEFQMDFEEFQEAFVIMAAVKRQHSGGGRLQPSIKECLQEITSTAFFENPRSELRLQY